MLKRQHLYQIAHFVRAHSSGVVERHNHWRRDSTFTLPNGGRHLPRAAVLAAMERLSFEYAVVVSASSRRRGFCGRDVGLRRMLFHGPQSGIVRVQPVFQKTFESQPLPAPHCDTKRCPAKGHGKFVTVRIIIIR